MSISFRTVCRPASLALASLVSANPAYVLAAEAVDPPIVAAEPPAVTPTATSKKVIGTQESDVAGQIVVTARRTEESLQEVPMAVAVLDAKALAEKVIVSTQDLATVSPGLSGAESFSSAKPGSSTFAIRGQSEAFPGSPPAVLPYLDEVAEFSSFLYDLGNIQVLKGPQGTLFGKNTTGGAILLSPRRPTDTLSGHFSARVSNDQGRNLDFAVGGPLIEDLLSVRIAGQRLRSDGHTRNLSDDSDFFDKHRESYRLSVALTPLDTLENITLVQVDHIDENGPTFVLSHFLNQPTTPFYLELGQYLEEQEARGPRQVESGDLRPKLWYESIGAINRTTWDVGEHWTLKNIVSHHHSDIENVTDADGSRFPILQGEIPGESDPIRRWTEELQLTFETDRYRAVAGAYYDDRRQKMSVLHAGASLPGSTSLAPLPFYVILKGTYAPSVDRSVAFYLQGTVGDLLVEGLDLTMGVRRTRDKRVANLQSIVGVGPCCDSAVEYELIPPSRYALKSSATTWNASIDYDLADDLMVYGTVRRGYKAGGFNANADPNRHFYAPEYVTDYELGLKSLWWIGDHAVRLNLDAFFDDYTDIQRYVIAPGVPLPANVVTNAAKATIVGFELDAAAELTSWLDITLQYTLLDTEYQEYTDPSYGDQTRSKFPNTPRHQVLVVPRLHVGNVSTSITYYWQSDTSFLVPNTANGVPLNDQAIAGSQGSAFHKLNFRADWRQVAGSGFSLGAYVQNLTNETYRIGSQNFMGTSIVGVASFAYAQPRAYGIDLRYDF